MVEQSDVPPHREGLEEGMELWPNQEPGWHRKTRDGEMFQGEFNTRALHGRIPLSRYCMTKRRHEQHNAGEIAPS
jgi:hypothetical protein